VPPSEPDPAFSDGASAGGATGGGGPYNNRVTIGELSKLLQRTTGVADATEESPNARRDRASADDAELDVSLKKIVAIIAMGAQILISDAVFIVWGSMNGWDIDATAIGIWLSATVVEVIGVVYVITSYLFPKRRGKK
jgi:hypothetical protein